MTSSRHLSRIVSLLLGIVLPLGTATPTHAADLYWDTNGAAAGAGNTNSPSGEWNTTAANWTSAVAGNASTQAWVSGETAVFSAGNNATESYTITVTGTLSVGGIRFEEGRPTITGGILNMGAATISNTNAPQTYIVSQIQGSGTLTLAGANQNFLNGVISDKGGTRSIVMQSGQWVFGGAHTYSGGTTINAGEAAVTVDSSSPGGTLTSGPFGTGIVQFNGGIMRPSATVSRTVANPVVFGGDVALGMTNYTATLSLTGPLTLTGNRILTVNNASTSGVVSFHGVLGESGGSFGFTKKGNAVLSLNASNTFTGGVTIDSGTLRLGHAGALNAATPNAVAFASNSSGTLQLYGHSVTIAGLNTDATMPGTTVVENGSGTNAILTVDNAATNTFAGVLRDGASGTLGLTKSNSGLLVLAGTSTYTGATEINAGTLALATGATIAHSPIIKLATSTAILDVTAGGLTLASGQTLTGIGTVAGSLTVADGSTLSPGLSPGTLTTGSQTWAGGGQYWWEINDAAGTAGQEPGWDLLVIQGDLTLTATADNPFDIHITSLLPDTNTPGDVANFDNSAEYTWTIAQYSGSFAMTGEDDFASRFNLVNDFRNPLGEGTFSLIHDEARRQINLVFSNSHLLVPEPASLLMFGLGWGIVVVRRKRRLR